VHIITNNESLEKGGSWELFDDIFSSKEELFLICLYPRVIFPNATSTTLSKS
jgi:hypothetical protein